MRFSHADGLEVDAGGAEARGDAAQLQQQPGRLIEQEHDFPLQAKQAEVERLRSEYRQLRDSNWQDAGRYDQWMDGPLNNAKLLPFGLYD